MAAASQCNTHDSIFIRTESTMWQWHAVSLGTIIISGVMKMVCCCAILFFPHYLYTVFALNLCTMTDIECTQKCIHMYVHVYVLLVM